LIEGVAPSVWIAAATAVVLLIGLKLFFGRGGPRDENGRRQFRLRPLRRLVGILVLGLACVSGLLAVSVYQFFRLTSDQQIAVVTLQKQGDRLFLAQAQVPGRPASEFQLRGDEWQIDARVVRWQLPALLAGVPPLYRLERLSGRYEDTAADQAGPRTVFALGDPRIPDLATLKRRFPNWLPFVDVQYGSGAYMPMFDGARYGVYLDQRGALFIRPADSATADGLKQRGW
jgi:hypothetical protein